LLGGLYIAWVVVPFVALFGVYLTARAIREGWHAGRLAIEMKAKRIEERRQAKRGDVYCAT
jgi:hypothetical protein